MTRMLNTKEWLNHVAFRDLEERKHRKERLDRLKELIAAHLQAGAISIPNEDTVPALMFVPFELLKTLEFEAESLNDWAGKYGWQLMLSYGTDGIGNVIYFRIRK